MAAVDLYAPHPLVLDVLFSGLSVYEKYIVPVAPILRNRGLKKAYDLIVMDDENTSYQCVAAGMILLYDLPRSSLTLALDLQ